jgi:RNA polymerase sigma-70 factor (ECF subfamily)
MSATDGELVARVLSGDDAAYALLFKRWARVVHALALARTGRREPAAEVTRRAFERAHEALDRIPPGVRFSHFLLSQVQELCAAHLRDHPRSMQMLRVGPDEARRTGPAVDLRTVLRRLSPPDAGLLLLEVASRLPPNYEIPFLLRYLEGLDYAAVAETTGVPLAEVRTALDSGRRLFEREFRFAVEKAGGPA